MDVKYTLAHSAAFNGQVLNYYVTESEIELEGAVYTRFGVAVVMSGGGESRFTDIYGDRDRAAALADTLCRCLVTPVTLEDIVYDTLCAEDEAAV